MKLSIIIPAYNVEKYIGRCLDSIYNQGVEENIFEVIVVNDGSQDTTAKIVMSYVDSHFNCKLINQKNEGLSTARNNGFSYARGEYVWFVDSDDAIMPNSISTILDYCEQFSHADFLIFDCIHLNMQNGTQEYYGALGKKHIGFHLKKKNDLYLKPLNRSVANERLCSAVNWLQIYRRDFLIKNDLYFATGIIHEDDEIRLRLFFFAKEIRYIPYAHYIYTMLRPGGITDATWRVVTMKSVKYWLKTIELWDYFCMQHVKSKADKTFVSGFYKTKYSQLMLLCNTPHDSEMYSLYLAHRKEWRKKYIKSFWASHSVSLIEYVRFFIILFCPQYIEYMSPL